MDEIRKTAKTVEEAIAAALAELGVSREETDITVIDEGTKAFLGMFGGKAGEKELSAGTGGRKFPA